MHDLAHTLCNGKTFYFPSLGKGRQQGSDTYRWFNLAEVNFFELTERNTDPADLLPRGWFEKAVKQLQPMRLMCGSARCEEKVSGLRMSRGCKFQSARRSFVSKGNDVDRGQTRPSALFV